jgi:single-stranded DNA-binding protein
MIVSFQGRVGKDSVTGEKDGKPWAAFSIAETVRKETVWRDVIVFGYLCSFVEEWVKQGTCLFVSGTLGDIKEYEGDYKVQVIANHLEFGLTSKSKSDGKSSSKPDKFKKGKSMKKKKPTPPVEEEEEEDDDWGDDDDE